MNEYNACVALGEMIMEGCPIPDAEDFCADDKFQCKINKVNILWLYANLFTSAFDILYLVYNVILYVML